MRTTRAEALKLGYKIDDYSSPPIAYKGMRYDTDDWCSTYTELETELITALQAVMARVNGVFDHPALVAYGPLMPSASADCYLIAEQALAKAGVSP